MDFSKITLGELLSNSNDIIKRNALSILKQLQKSIKTEVGICPQCGSPKSLLHFRQIGSMTALVAEKCPECAYHWER